MLIGRTLCMYGGREYLTLVLFGSLGWSNNENYLRQINRRKSNLLSITRNTVIKDSENKEK